MVLNKTYTGDRIKTKFGEYPAFEIYVSRKAHTQ